jgi:hypothetical protein
MVLSLRTPHSVPMAKTWVPTNDTKSVKAFAKAMRLLMSPKGRQRPPRPR